MRTQRVVECDAHGATRAAFICKHLVASLDDRVNRGVNCVRSDIGEVNAWCDACDARLIADGGA
ncbi:hypothetical protein jaqu_23970 [Jannaschia aquimarina]|uniref:Uncharacterized protein n=1 Tax=Jannaschia aquimarina TaxID=935700 RepID=A0A0D1CM56_9RHOB|nr:hypothetical protein jaqu_23970 [Jannaschia aquimarina]SNT09299.1 hypothetical protein SAMN05421775_105212 [Jannaschia aquimarina]